MIKTAIENNQNLIVEGCYIPFDWKKGLEEYIDSIKYYCIIFSEKYIRNNFDDIVRYGNVIESRLSNDFAMDELISVNKYNLEMVSDYGLDYIYIDKEYRVDL